VSNPTSFRRKDIKKTLILLTLQNADDKTNPTCLGKEEEPFPRFFGDGSSFIYIYNNTL
jgi:hypothetical protein